MASASFGDGNRGLQAHTINGPVHAEFHPPPGSEPALTTVSERPETPPRPSAAIPFPRDADFIERGTILDEVHRRCAVAGSWAALVGLGGVGKSQLAIEYAYQTRERSAETWVLWVHASSAARFEQSYRDIADRVKMFGRKDPKADIFKLVHDWLCNSKERWLLVLDNVDDARFLVDIPIAERDGAADPRNTPKPLRSYIPQSERGSVLVTTRNKGAALRLVERRNIISVQPMNDVQASALFEKKLEKEEDPIDIDKLVEALEYMPLAIVQAAAYITQRASRCSVRQYLDEFRRSERKRTSLLIRDEGQLRRDWEAKNSILVTWQISFEHIQQTRPSAADLLSLMSFFDRQGIPADLLRGRAAQTGVIEQQEQEADDPSSGEEGDTTSQSSEGDNGFEDDVVALRNFCFISIERNSRNFEMHALVQLATRMWLNSNNQMGQEFPCGSFENRARCQALFPHVASIFGEKPAEEDLLQDWAQVLSNAGWYLWMKGQYKEAEGVARKAVETRESIAGHDAVLTLCSYQGKYEAAEAMNRRALEGREKALGNEHPDTLTSVSNLALVLRDQGKYDKAEKLIRQALERKKNALGEQHLSTLTSVSNLALVLRDQGKYDKAEKLILRVLEGRKKELGEQHPDTLTSISNLALVLRDQGKYDKAEKLNWRALEGREEELGEKHPSTLAGVSNLALVLRDQGKYDEAEKLIRRALEGYENELGDQHPDTLTSVDNLAGVLQYQEKYDEAEKLIQRALEGRKKELGEQHPDTLTSMSNLALVLRYQGKYGEAEKLNRRALEGSEKGLGAEHPDTLTSVSNLALVLRDQGKYEESEKLIRRALEWRENELGEQHPSTLTSVNNLALVLQYQGKYDETEKLIRRSLEGREKELGKDHPDTLTSVYCLAYLLHKQKQYVGALELYQRACDGYRQMLGSQHSKTIACLNYLSDMRREAEQEELGQSRTLVDNGKVAVREVSF
ncbi:TPR domain protein [Corynespora cassiicola Philippines]|uniref:TPR domain protein n=1 Tax=Corynespora cassiicola Philippines TaxID=1448308 RepID=A0A2T2N0V3_CORCC|nr:TPR domain protein [Corynespora cassiicola Philippines]